MTDPGAGLLITTAGACIAILALTNTIDGLGWTLVSITCAVIGTVAVWAATQ